MAMDSAPEDDPDHVITLKDVDRVYRLISHRVAMAALHDLYRYEGPLWVAQDVDRRTGIEALALLEEFGLITPMTPGVPDPSAPVTITASGIDLIETLAERHSE